MIATQLLAAEGPPDLAARVRSVFGSPSDSMSDVQRRARKLLGDHKVIVWEGDAATFKFLYVGGDAELLLGHAMDRWTDEPTFWADTVVHPEDRDEAIAFCALATGRSQDHDFVYRAVRSDGGTVWLHDIVTVVRGPRGVAERLRGIMIDVSNHHGAPVLPA